MANYIYDCSLIDAETGDTVLEWYSDTFQGAEEQIEKWLTRTDYYQCHVIMDTIDADTGEILSIDDYWLTVSNWGAMLRVENTYDAEEGF